MTRFHALCRACASPSFGRDLLRDQSGVVAVMAGLMFPVLIGGMGLGAEAGYWYFLQRELQQAADVSAHAAGVYKRDGHSAAEIKAAAERAAAASGFSSGEGTLTVHAPPTSGAFQGQSDAVELVLRRTENRLLSSIFSKDPVEMGGRAVVRITGGSSACVLALSKTASGAVTVAGSGTLTLTGCDVASNSNASDSLLLQGAGSLTADCAHTVGEADTTHRLVLTQCGNQVKENAPPVVDPYASVAEPQQPYGPCQAKDVGNKQNKTTLTPTYDHSSGVKSMYFCNGLTIKGDVHFNPGLYIIDGDKLSEDLALTGNVTLTGEGVTFYFANAASLQLTGNGTVNFSAPTTGPFAGILIFGTRDPMAGVTHKAVGTTGSTFNGAIYTPASSIEFRGNSAASNACTQIVADTITFSGNSGIGSNCTAAGTTTAKVAQTVRVVE